MEARPTTAAVQGYLNELAGLRGDEPAEPIVRELLERSARRLHMLCAAMLHRSYPRLASPPLSLQSEEMLSAVVERMLKAMRAVHPKTVSQFFALANKHMRWELNDLARQLDQQTPTEELVESIAAPPPSSHSQLAPGARRILEAIELLPEPEREAFSLVRIQGMQHTEAAEILCVSTKTIQRRVNRALVLLSRGISEGSASYPPGEI